MKKLIVILAVLTVLVAGAALFAQGKGHGMRGGNGGGMGMGMGGWFSEAVLKDVGVSDSVRKEIREIAFQARKDMMDNQFQIREKRIVLHKEFLKANLDEGKINSLTQELWELQKLQFQKIEKSRLAIAKLLTPDQREKLSKLVYERKREFWGGMRYYDRD